MTIACQFVDLGVAGGFRSECLNCGRVVPTPRNGRKLVATCLVFPSGEFMEHPERIGGPGTELKSLLEWWGIHDSGKCGCQAFAAKMDAWGPDGCDERMGEILDHLRDAARELGVTYSRFTAWLLVRRAIARARLAAQ